jgi:hypothetical protein
MKKEVPVEQLQFGVYVSELDRPWTDTPFVFQGFVLENEEQLATLKKYCKKVYVDPEKATDLPDRSRLKTASPRAKHESVLASITRKVVYEEKVSVDVELPVARAAQNKTEAVLKDVFETVQHDRQRRAQSGRDAAALEVEGEGRVDARSRPRCIHLHDHVWPLSAAAARAARFAGHARAAARCRQGAPAGRIARED